jgi:hypothetical protein
MEEWFERPVCIVLLLWRTIASYSLRTVNCQPESPCAYAAPDIIIGSRKLLDGSIPLFRAQRNEGIDHSCPSGGQTRCDRGDQH